MKTDDDVTIAQYIISLIILQPHLLSAVLPMDKELAPSY